MIISKELRPPEIACNAKYTLIKVGHPMKTYRLALIGFGNVGQGLAHVLLE